jgi:hypothetical protein
MCWLAPERDRLRRSEVFGAMMFRIAPKQFFPSLSIVLIPRAAKVSCDINTLPRFIDIILQGNPG